MIDNICSWKSIQTHTLDYTLGTLPHFGLSTYFTHIRLVYPSPRWWMCPAIHLIPSSFPDLEIQQRPGVGFPTWRNRDPAAFQCFMVRSQVVVPSKKSQILLKRPLPKWREKTPWRIKKWVVFSTFANWFRILLWNPNLVRVENVKQHSRFDLALKVRCGCFFIIAFLIPMM